MHDRNPSVAMRILIVEDEPRLLRNLVKALREEGYAVDTAEAGDDGLYKAECYDYDAVVLDVLLPGLGARFRTIQAGRARSVPGPRRNARRWALNVSSRCSRRGTRSADYCERVFSMTASSALALASPRAARATRSEVMASFARSTAMSWLAVMPGIRCTACSAITPPA